MYHLTKVGLMRPVGVETERKYTLGSAESTKWDKPSIEVRFSNLIPDLTCEHYRYAYGTQHLERFADTEIIKSSFCRSRYVL
jgi:hypothetical protein